MEAKDSKQLAIISSGVIPSGDGHEESIQRYQERRRKKPPVVNNTRYEDPVITLAKYSDAFGSISDDFRSLIFEQVGACSAHQDKSMVLNSCLAMLNSFKPENELETLILSEIFFLHNALAEMTRWLMQAQHPQLAESLVNCIDRISRAIRENVAAFQKLRRGNITQQKVTVEHVHIHEGAQTVIGNVNHSRGEGGH
jgi:hypothetical protein